VDALLVAAQPICSRAVAPWAGGQGSGSTTGSINSGIEAIFATSTTKVNGAATGTFTGNGSGNYYGSIANQPYAGGYVKGGGSGTGTAHVGGESLLAFDDDFLISTEAAAGFNSNGGGSGFVESPFGGVVGNAAGGASATSAGNAVVDGSSRANSLMMFSGSSAANSIGEFIGCFSPSFSSGLTGGQGSGNGSLNVAGAASNTGVRMDDRTALGVGTAMSVGGGAASGFNSLGEAGGLGSGSTTGSATGAFDAFAGQRLSMAMVQLRATSTRPEPEASAHLVAVSYSPDSAYNQRYLFSCKLCL
jgi:hypothetical protein